ncbi:hypothetical protein GCM10010145_32960 [Streptomyces ruber]|uniref:4-oxalomesaconate tautomerase n=2 Tax=Streptomyces TaxID=1883 RepID=A0A918BCZ2_9ACTN|nr:PrpF domain-containing protein [Streptomyces ruber]GGQ60266.1 hypothetical protein GCM10010145_32960 [Streptomyces ruber]
MDNGMPTVLVPASALGVTGYETPGELEGNQQLAGRLQEVRSAAGRLMGLGDVEGTTVPKPTLLAPPRDGGAVMTRTFVPVRCHASTGVLGAASVAAGPFAPGGVAEGIAKLPGGPGAGGRVRVEHPTGYLDPDPDLDLDTGPGPGAVAVPGPVVRRTAVARTARRIFYGTVFPRPAGTAPVSPGA